MDDEEIRKEAVNRAFRKVDKDGNGFIDWIEFKTLLNAIADEVGEPVKNELLSLETNVKIIIVNYG